MGTDFSMALHALKQGQRIARAGWNGKGLWVMLNRTLEDEGYVVGANGEGRWKRLNPHFLIKNAQDSLDTWVPSVSDLLAEDWEVVE